MRIQIKEILKIFIAFCLVTSCKYRKADWVVFNANVYTVNESFEKVTAFAIKDGKFISVGGDEIVSLYPNALKFDAKGLPIYPGFIDAHCHFFNLGLSLGQVDLRGTKSIEEIEKRLQSYSQNNQFDIIIGRGWDQNLWKNKVFPNNDFLNRLFPDKLVLLRRIDGHALLVNDLVIKKAEINSKTRVSGGSILIENNKPSGILIDNAMDLAMNILPSKSSKIISKALIDAQTKAFENGLTTVDDAGLNKRTIMIIDSLQKKGDLKIRVYAMISNTSDNLNYFLDKGIIEQEKLTVRSVKAYLDGALGSRGALLKKPYSDDDKNKIDIQRSAEMIYGLRNFIGNAIKFSKSKVNIFLMSDNKEIKIIINDDGPGFPKDIIDKLGEPYIKSRSLELNPNSGLGLGTFLGKTLLERQNARLLFKDDKNLGGASVVISWSPKNILL